MRRTFAIWGSAFLLFPMHVFAQVNLSENSSEVTRRIIEKAQSDIDRVMQDANVKIRQIVQDAKSEIQKQAIAPPRKITSETVSDGRKAGSEFRDCKTCPELVVITSGTYQMGTELLNGLSKKDPFSSIQYSTDSEIPQHAVNIKSFAIGKYEVTQEEWLAVMGSFPKTFFNVIKQGNRLPMTQVTWKDADAFAKALSKKTGQSYRLPTEAEWEYVARAGSKNNVFPYAGGESALSDYEWYRDNNTEKSLQPVGTKRPNAFGVHDMLGNASEFVADCFQQDYTKTPRDGSAAGPETDPKRRMVPRPGENCWRVIRGATASSSLQELRPASRNNGPDITSTTGIGFRLARDLRN